MQHFKQKIKIIKEDESQNMSAIVVKEEKRSVKTLASKVTLHALLLLKKQANIFDHFTYGLN